MSLSEARARLWVAAAACLAFAADRERKLATLPV